METRRRPTAIRRPRARHFSHAHLDPPRAPVRPAGRASRLRPVPCHALAIIAHDAKNPAAPGSSRVDAVASSGRNRVRLRGRRRGLGRRGRRHRPGGGFLLRLAGHLPAQRLERTRPKELAVEFMTHRHHLLSVTTALRGRHQAMLRLVPAADKRVPPLDAAPREREIAPFEEAP